MTQDSTTTGSDTETTLSPLEVAERISGLLSPFVQLATVIVQALTAYTLVRQL